MMIPTMIPTTASMLAEFERNADAFAESVENNPWVHEWRRVIDVADRVADRDVRQKIIDDFVRRFKADEARRYPR
jgi:hypothetical protein